MKRNERCCRRRSPLAKWSIVTHGIENDVGLDRRSDEGRCRYLLVANYYATGNPRHFFHSEAQFPSLSLFFVWATLDVGGWIVHPSITIHLLRHKNGTWYIRNNSAPSVETGIQPIANQPTAGSNKTEFHSCLTTRPSRPIHPFFKHKHGSWWCHSYHPFISCERQKEKPSAISLAPLHFL